MPFKKEYVAPPAPPPPDRAGISTDGRYVDPFAPKQNHWELETDESGMQALGGMIGTINDLSDFLTLYFCTQARVFFFYICLSILAQLLHWVTTPRAIEIKHLTDIASSVSLHLYEHSP
jgi:hypothetical protein